MSSSSYVHYHDNTTFTILDGSNVSSTQLPKVSSDWWRELVHSPDWSELRSQLRWAWNLHIYGLACLFLALACASFFTILALRAQLSSKPHLSTLNVFLCLLGTARAVALFIDPYGSEKTIPLVMSRIIWDLGYPCLLSAFALLQLSFLRMSKIKIVVPSSRLSGETAASVIVTSHFCLIIMSDILWALRNSFRIVWLLTQVVFVLWGLFLCLTFLCGCLRLLRSMAELPLQVLCQLEPSYEVKGVPLGLVLSPSSSHHNNSRLATPSQHRTPSTIHPPTLTKSSSSTDSPFGPKIRITDDNEQTYSYVSDTSPAPFAEQRTLAQDTQTQKVVSPTTKSWIPSRKSDNTASSEDPALVRPLMSDQVTVLRSPLMEENADQDRVLNEIRPNGPATISSMRTTASFVQRPLRLATSPLEEFKFDARKLKTKHSTRLEKLLRRLILTSALGTLLCLLRAYDVFGPHGLASNRQDAAILPWFCYQTICRIVEFFMGCSMARITRQSVHNHSYHYCGAAKKHRDPFCHMNH